MSEPNELIAAAELGEEGRKFMESDLGRCLLGMAEQEVRSAQEDLMTVSATDVQKIMTLQNQAKFGLSFEAWLRELVSKGENAIAVHMQQKQGD